MRLLLRKPRSSPKADSLTKTWRELEPGVRPSTEDNAALAVNCLSAVVRQIDEEADLALTSNPAGAAEVAGVLLGSYGPIVEITASEPVLLMQERDRAYALAGPGSIAFKRMKTASREAPNGECSVVGFYRSHIGKAFELTEEDRALIRACFADTPQVPLLAKRTGDGPSAVRLFLVDQSGGFCELYQEEDALREVDPSNEELEANCNHSTYSDAPVFRERIAKESSSEFNPWSVRQVAVFVAKVILIALLGYMILKGSARLRKQREISASPDPQVALDSSRQPSFALRAKRQGADLRLTWDRSAPMLSKAKEGTLTISDGDAPGREIWLDEDVLRTGSVVYSPVARDVLFRLAVFDQAGAKIGESVAASP